MKKKQSAADKKNRAKDSYYTALHSHMNAVNNMNVRFTFLAGGLFALQTAQREIKNCTLSPRWPSWSLAEGRGGYLFSFLFNLNLTVGFDVPWHISLLTSVPVKQAQIHSCWCLWYSLHICTDMDIQLWSKTYSHHGVFNKSFLRWQRGTISCNQSWSLMKSVLYS